MRKTVTNTRRQYFRLPIAEIIIVTLFGVWCFTFLPGAQQAQREKVQKQWAEVVKESRMFDIPELVISENNAMNSNITTTDEPKYEPQEMYVTEGIHIRSAAGIESSILSLYSANSVVTVIGEENGWYQTNKGWICGEYVREYNAEDYIDIGLDYQYQDLIRESLELFELDVDEYFIYGMIYTESRFNTKETSGAHAQGLMQVTPSTWRILYGRLKQEYSEFAEKHVINDPYDISSNLVMGIYCLRTLLDEENLTSLKEYSSQILTCYNRGAGGAHTYRSTHGDYNSSYAQNVLRAAEFIRTHKYWEEGI